MTTPDERLGHPPADLLWILAHPDDETYGSTGTMAWALSRGLRTAYVCATRGEAGTISDSALATPETLGAIREQELRVAMSLVGMTELRLLGFRDSGMEDTPDNEDPRALMQQPDDVILAHLVGHIRDLRPTTVITFGPEGIYGHPDHIRIGHLAARAVELAADASYLPELHAPWRAKALYFAAAPRELILEMADHPDQPLGEISEASRRNLGTPMAEITHRLDITPWVPVKRRAIAAHRTQPLPDDDLAGDPAEAREEFEYYTRQPLPWDPEMRADDPFTLAAAEIGATASAPDQTP